MAFDTKYRPLQYDDVLGHDEYKVVLRQFVLGGTGFHQSYLFCGQHGSGKTTFGRILARALLCTNNTTGDPCDQCESCLAVLEDRSECFTEFDAATNSGKEDIRQIVDELQYSTFSGQQRIYLFDESHQLSKQALDAMLKPMEESQPGTENKQLVCIFCTTEPEKMRSTIFSRCAPAFTIRPCHPDEIAGRLAYVCEQEGIEYDHEALILLAEFHESHIRDALKSLEGVSKMGAVTKEHAHGYLRLQANELCATVLSNLGTDLAVVLDTAESLNEFISPAVSYKRLGEVAMLAFKVAVGAGKVPTFWDTEVLKSLGAMHADYLLVIADHLSSRPARPSQAMLLCDLAHLHHGKLGTLPSMSVMPAATSVPATPAPPAAQVAVAAAPSAAPTATPTNPASLPTASTAPMTEASSVGKVANDPQSDPRITPKLGDQKAAHVNGHPTESSTGGVLSSDIEFYRVAIQRRLAELRDAGRGSSRRTNMGSS